MPSVAKRTDRAEYAWGFCKEAGPFDSRLVTAWPDDADRPVFALDDPTLGNTGLQIQPPLLDTVASARRCRDDLDGEDREWSVVPRRGRRHRDRADHQIGLDLAVRAHAHDTAWKSESAEIVLRDIWLKERHEHIHDLLMREGWRRSHEQRSVHQLVTIPVVGKAMELRESPALVRH
jgi:hypothetical protein